MAVTNMLLQEPFIVSWKGTCALTMKCCGHSAVNIIEYGFIYASLLIHYSSRLHARCVCVCWLGTS